MLEFLTHFLWESECRTQLIQNNCFAHKRLFLYSYSLFCPITQIIISHTWKQILFQINSPRYRMSWIQLYTLFWMDQRSFQTSPSNVEKSAVLNFWDERGDGEKIAPFILIILLSPAGLFFSTSHNAYFWSICFLFHCSFFEFVSDPYTVCFQHKQWHKNSYSRPPVSRSLFICCINSVHSTVISIKK